MEFHCDLTLAGRYTQAEPNKSSKLTLRGRHGYSSHIQDCFEVICAHTEKAGINLAASMEYVWIPEANDIEPKNIFRDRIKFLMEYFCVGP